MKKHRDEGDRLRDEMREEKAKEAPQQPLPRQWPKSDPNKKAKAGPAGSCPPPQPQHGKKVGLDAADADRPADDVHLTDRGNAIRLVRQHGADLRYCHPWEEWLCWDGSYWRADDTGEASRRAKQVVAALFREATAAMMAGSIPGSADVVERQARLKQLQQVQAWALKSEAAARLNAILDVARSEPGIPVLAADFDRDGMLFNCRNGTVDLRTGKLREHRREDLITRLCPVEFHPKAECTTWLRFLEDVFPAPDGKGPDFDVIDYLQRLCGYFLTGDVSEHVLPVWHGCGGNGKGVLLNTLLKVMGEGYACAASPDLLMTRRGERHPTEIATLYRKRLVVCQETAQGCPLNEALVKWLTGGDRLQARRMREDLWEFDPTHKAVLVSNYKPEIRGTDGGIWRRIHLVPFEVTFTGDKKDTKLPEKLLAELPGILAWMVRGCLEWQRHGLKTPQKVLAATKEYREEEDVVGQFLAERCTRGELLSVKASLLYDAFKRWQEQAGESKVTSQKAFGTAMTRQGFTRKNTNGTVYEGLRLG